MKKTLILFSTTDGHTKKVCTHIQQTMEDTENAVTLASIDPTDNNNFSSVNLSSFNKIVIGASIRYGKHSKNTYNFIKTHKQLLASKPNAFFSVNAVARKQNKNSPDTNPYIKKFLNEVSWQPNHVAVIAGKVDYKKYNFFDRNLIRLIMWLTKGPTDPKACVEFTDWAQVELFGKTLKNM